MKVVCCGYRDRQKNIVPCGKVIKDGDDSNGVSHGICDDCFQITKEIILEKRNQRRPGMNAYTFDFTVKISESSSVIGSYTVLADDYVSAELEFRECLKYGFGKDADIQVWLSEPSLSEVIAREAA